MPDGGRWLWFKRIWRWAVLTVVAVTVFVTWTMTFKEPILIYDAETVASNKRSNLFTATDKEFSLTPNINKSNSKSAKGNDLKSTNKGSKMKSTLKERGSKSITKGIDLKSTTKGSNLMIVSYMRGGSSMNGKVFGENPESLYVFEPLSKFAPHHYFTDNEQCSMSEKQCRSDHDDNASESKTMDTNRTKQNIEYEYAKTAPVWKLREGVINTLKNIYSCDIAGLEDEVLRRIMFGWLHGKCKSGEIWGNFTTCYINLVEPNVTDYFHYALAARKTEFDKHKHILRLLEHGGTKAASFRKCLDKLELHCRESNLRVTKVLRLSLRFLPLLMDQIPDLKVLFVIRDPRGIINSRINTDWYGIEDDQPGAVKDNIKSLCFKMQEDIKMIDVLKRDYPGRFLDFKLDDIVKQSMKTYQTIFRFANLEMTNTYLEKIEEVVNANPSFLTRWNETLNPKYTNWTQQYCHQSLKRYGFAKIVF